MLSAATGSSPLKPRQHVIRHRSAEPLPSPPPSKAIDLNSSTRSTDRETGQKVTRRAFLCDVVVEKEGEDTANLLASLGNPLQPLALLQAPPAVTNGRPNTPSRPLVHPAEDADEAIGGARGWANSRQPETSARLMNLIEELVKTERSYLSRIHALKTSYADRLRLFSRDANQQLIPQYEAKAMFANIEAIVPASAAFLTDLDAMLESGHATESVGDVCLRHLKILRTFDPYRTYLSKQDESQRLFQESLRKFPGFALFIESTKYQTTGIGNIGLRELLMEPVQRIPRYTLLWQTMIKCMSPLSSQRAQLLEAIDIASGIARCEPDPRTVRAMVMYNLERNIEDFPAKLFSNNRDYLDSLDVEDLPAEYPTASSPPSRPLSSLGSRPLSISSTSNPSMASFGSLTSQSPPTIHAAGAPLHCTLFLFNDKLMIVKRQSSSISGRRITGTDDIQKLVRAPTVLDKSVIKKDKLSFRGQVDILDVIASDVGNGDQTGRWAARPFRSYAVVHPPYSVALDPIATRRDKLRFLHNLWSAQACARAKVTTDSLSRTSRVLMSESEIGLERAGEPMGRARCYWSIWSREDWNNQRKVVLHIDEAGMATDIIVDEDNPLLCIRLQPMAGGMCRFSYSTADAVNEERVVIDTSEVLERVVTTSKSSPCGRLADGSVHKYGIFKFRTGTTSCPTTPSAASHRLRPAMLNLDVISRNLFGAGSISGRSDIFSTKASRSTGSRSSTMDLMDDASRKRLSQRSTSPFDGLTRSSRGLVAGAPYEDGMRQSEVDLNARLDLAKNNSRSVAVQDEDGADESEDVQGYEAEDRLGEAAHAEMRKTPSPVRGLGRIADETPRALLSTSGNKDSQIVKSTIATEDTIFTSPRQLASPPPPLPALSTRPAGPRSPLAGASFSPTGQASSAQLPSIGSAHTRLRIVSGGGRRISVGRETVPLKGFDEGEPHSTPTTHVAAKRQHSADNLTPRKRSPPRSPLHSRDVSNSSIAPSEKTTSCRRPSGKFTPTRSSGPLTTPRTVSAVGSVQSNVTVEEVDIKGSQDIGAILDVTAKKQMTKDVRTKDLVHRLERNTSLPRSPQRRNMNRLVEHDDYGVAPARSPISGRQEVDAIVLDECARGVSSIIERLEGHLRQAEMGNSQAITLAKQLIEDRQQHSQQLRTLQGQVLRSGEHNDLLQRQLGDAQIELDVIYEAFNTELDGMFSDAQLPETDAFTALQNDLQTTKASRNMLELENRKLKYDLERANLEREQWARMLRPQGHDL
ncbi:uncharacterized protein I303_106783 [Kwoniella dejecticola CBS 10117]|uniref:DH domain-containing protein n=1 Tax=Kwoniella dejecticola CBS 10117 TaxID=1296121 RepID=A0AAJ8KVE2_9TREE